MPPPPPMLCARMPCAPSPAVVIVPAASLVTVTDPPVLPVPPVPPTLRVSLSLPVAAPDTSPPLPPPPPMLWAWMPVAFEPPVTIAPPFVTRTPPPRLPVPPSPPTVSLATRVSAIGSLFSTSLRVLSNETPEVATAEAGPALPPPPPTLSASTPIAASPPVVTLPACSTVTSPPVPPPPPVPPLWSRFLPPMPRVMVTFWRRLRVLAVAVAPPPEPPPPPMLTASMPDALSPEVRTAPLLVTRALPPLPPPPPVPPRVVVAATAICPGGATASA